MRSLALSAAAVAACAAIAAACSNKPGAADAGGSCADAACADKNPAGDCYPTDGIGTTARSGSVAGDRIQNFSFQGYVNLDPTTKTKSGQLQAVKLSDFYDPKGAKYKVIRIITSAGWCAPCIMETQFISMAGGLAETLAPQGVVFLQALMEGVTAGMGSVQADLDDWITKQQPNFTEVLDPNGTNLGVFGAPSTVPFSATIDARSMEILARDKGFTDGQKLQADVQTWLSWTASNAPLAKACP